MTNVLCYGSHVDVSLSAASCQFHHHWLPCSTTHHLNGAAFSPSTQVTPLQPSILSKATLVTKTCSQFVNHSALGSVSSFRHLLALSHRCVFYPHLLLKTPKHLNIFVRNLWALWALWKEEQCVLHDSVSQYNLSSHVFSWFYVLFPPCMLNRKDYPSAISAYIARCRIIFYKCNLVEGKSLGHLSFLTKCVRTI